MLIFELRMMGDAIMSLPFIHGASITHDVYICCSPSGKSIYESIVSPDHILCWDSPWNREKGKYSPRHLKESRVCGFIDNLRSLNADIAVSAWADARTHLLMALSGAKVRVGFPMNHSNYLAHHIPYRKRQLQIGQLVYSLASIILGRPLLNGRINRANGQQHHVTDWKQVAESMGLCWKESIPWIPAEFATVPDEVKEFVAEAKRGGHPVVVIHPGARTPNRRWPLEKFIFVLKNHLEPRNWRCILISCPEVQSISYTSSNVVITGLQSIRELCGVVGVSDLVLCNDTGISHLASALGKPTITVFSSQNPNWFAPYGYRHLVVNTTACEYIGCFNYCILDSFVCLDSVSPELVIRKLKEYKY